MSSHDPRSILKGLSNEKLLDLLESELSKVEDGLNVCCAVVNTERDEQIKFAKVMHLIVDELKSRL